MKPTNENVFRVYFLAVLILWASAVVLLLAGCATGPRDVVQMGPDNDSRPLLPQRTADASPLPYYTLHP